MKPIEGASLIVGRLLAVLGALLVLLALTWPWLTLRINSALVPALELRITLSGSDISALGAADVTLVPKLDHLLDQVGRLDQSIRRDLEPASDLLAQLRHTGPLVGAWLIALWIPPIVAIVLAIVLLATNGALRYRRGFGAALVIVALISAGVLVLTRLRIDGALAVLRSTPGLAELLDSLEASSADLSLRVEQGATLAPLLAGLMVIGGLIELILPWRQTTAARSTAASVRSAHVPALQSAGASVDLAVVAPAAVELPTDQRRPCARCGKLLRVDARFCNSCGMRQE